MQLIAAIARREGTARQLAERFGYTTDELREFAKTHNSAIENFVNNKEDRLDTVTPTQLDELWISQKFERLTRLQSCAEIMFKEIKRERLEGSELATALREFRSYLMLAANELGQLLHRGSGDSGSGDTLSVEISGVDMDKMR